MTNNEILNSAELIGYNWFDSSSFNHFSFECFLVCNREITGNPTYNLWLIERNTICQRERELQPQSWGTVCKLKSSTIPELAQICEFIGSYFRWTGDCLYTNEPDGWLGTSSHVSIFSELSLQNQIISKILRNQVIPICGNCVEIGW